MEPITAKAPASARNAGLILLYACAIFLSAFLLFQVQPLIGKMLLPWFGGSAAVWSTCLLFFQVLLLLGYLYAHWTSRLLAPRAQALLHIALLAASIATLPIMPDPAWKPQGGEDPTWLIIGLMAAAVGLPYFLLSTTGPLLQAWFAREKSGAVPYRLFALSNFGSMLGLLSYPVIFEPRLTIPAISAGWSAAYALFALLCGLLAWRGVRTQRSAIPAAGKRPDARSLALWTLLAACPTVLLMGVTSHLTQNVAPVPFLWVLPLALYLLTFILCFESARWYRRSFYLFAFIVWLGVAGYDLVKTIAEDGVWLPVALYSIGLFVSCMLCHGELARMKPHPAHLTSYYLMIALGGAVGGAFVALAAPRLLNSNYELPIAALAIAIVVVTLVHRSRADAAPRGAGHRLWPAAMALAVAFISIPAAVGIASQNGFRHVMARNFYGTLGVMDTHVSGHRERQLVHGAILHGAQYLEGERRRWPTTYYGEKSGAGLAVMATRNPARTQSIGVIGLGAGTMAAYGRVGDRYRFYEINPLVMALAQSQFSYLRDSAATVETVLGDARLSLEREPAQQFDVLLVDAFSGDSIPVHLLTREAFAVYFRHMKPDGILAVHISNRNLDLAPVVKHAVDHYRKQARVVESERDEDRREISSTWVLISDRADIFDDARLRGHNEPLEAETAIRPWTDDYSSIYAILK
jgi:predicted O-methyltransferase YrrM